jgi:hypothetical protein
MIKLSNAGIEDSGITDAATGRRIYVTVTARKKFRAANPNFAKVRNVLLNTAMANDFARSKPQTKLFRVRKDPNAVGQVRDGTGGEYIAIVDSNSVKIVGFGRAGIPKLTGIAAPPRAPTGKPVPAPVAFSNNDFSLFIVKHAIDNMCEAYSLNEERLHSVIDLLSERTRLSIEDVVRKLETLGDDETVSLLCSDNQADYLHTTENKNMQIADPIYEMQSDLPSSGFAAQVGLAER